MTDEAFLGHAKVCAAVIAGNRLVFTECPRWPVPGAPDPDVFALAHAPAADRSHGDRCHEETGAPNANVGSVTSTSHAADRNRARTARALRQPDLRQPDLRHHQGTYPSMARR